jgi:2-polyprenyl-3-methyl-5-hydroxy-6-metoxy-1,4-benzoquinol methylase
MDGNMNKEGYDNIYKKSEMYAKHYTEILDFYKVWDTITEIVKGHSIIDLGCGCGHFANMLYDKGHEKYLGVDFSDIAIEKCKGLNLKRLFKFQCENLEKFLLKTIKRDDIYTAIELFEHLEDDKYVISLLPKNSLLVFSVPNFTSQNHYRVYSDADFIKEYYKDILQINKIHEPIEKQKGKLIFIIESYTK